MFTIVLFYLYYLSSTIQNVTDEAEIDKFGYEHSEKSALIRTNSPIHIIRVFCLCSFLHALCHLINMCKSE